MLARRDTRMEASRLRRLSPLQPLEDQSPSWGIRCHSCTGREDLSPSWQLSYKTYVLRFAREQGSLSTNGSHEAFHRIHMDFTHAVAIVIASELAPSMVDTLMIISPDLQTGINAVLICIHPCPRDDRVFDEGFDGLLLHIGQQIEHDLTTALHHPKDRRSFLR